MQKHRSFQLPRVAQHSPSPKSVQLGSEQLAEDYLFEISRGEDEHTPESFWKEFCKLSMGRKRLEKKTVSVPKKKVEMLPTVEINMDRYSHHDLNMEILNTTSYLLIDNRHSLHPPPPNTDRNTLHQQITRKAKHLFRGRNRNKLPIMEQPNQFSTSFYCHKMGP